MYEIYKSRIVARIVLVMMIFLFVLPVYTIIANGETLITSMITQNVNTKNTNKIFSSIYVEHLLDLNLNLKKVEIDKNENDKIENINEITYTDLDVPKGKEKSFKSYMGYQYITSKNSKQYLLKEQYVLDENTGIYMINGRYCCALGSYYTTDIGIVSIIPCILADSKSDSHTDYLNQYTLLNNSIVEFVVNEDVLIPKISTQWGNTGDISYLGGIFEGEIDFIRIYN